jgi:hypothetical protein
MTDGIAPGAAPALDGHPRLTLLDDDGAGCTAYVPAGRVAELVDAIGRRRVRRRRVSEKGRTVAGWARLREQAFRAARAGQHGAAAHLVWPRLLGTARARAASNSAWRPSTARAAGRA